MWELSGLDPETVALLVSGREATDEVHFAGERLLAVNQRPGSRPPPLRSANTRARCVT